ncbi:MAG: Rrf2 family transcriptional regulator [Anaerovoracaceae bacterium]
MQFNITTDYAIRTMLYIGDSKDRVIAEDISKNMVIPLNNVRKILQAMKRAELVEPLQGHGGGYILSRPLSEITLGEVVDAIGEKRVINRCLESDCFCSRGAVETCKVRLLYGKIQDTMDEVFSITLDNLME